MCTGCVLANRLSADPSNSVVLIEAGGEDSYPWIHVPVGYLYTMNNPRTDWCFKTTNQVGLNGKAIAYPRGKVLGGSSSINGMIFMTGSSNDYDTWCQKYNNPGWNAEAMLEELNEFVSFQTREQGRLWDQEVFKTDNTSKLENEWIVQDQRLRWEILDDFILAAAELGIPFSSNFNHSNEPSCGYFQVNQIKGRRLSAKTAFIKPIKHRINKNLRILKNTTAKKLVVDEKQNRHGSIQASGVEVFTTKSLSDEETLFVKAKREVILSCGAVNTPHLLQGKLLALSSNI